MKIHRNRRICSLLALAAAFPPIVCQAHDERLHMELSKSAFRSSDAIGAFLSVNLATEFAPYSDRPFLIAVPVDGLPSVVKTPMDWIAWGSYQEDMQDPALFGNPAWHFLRVCNHFYTVTPQRQPGEAGGLTDDSELLLPSPIANSFVWATTPGLLGPAVSQFFSAGPNVDTWWNARQHQYLALTLGQKSDREAMLAFMLYELGHVLHLNQDLSQPGHVRNDEHVPVLGHRQVIEDHGRKILADAAKSSFVHDQWFPLRPHGWLYWRDAGFTKLRHFWDRGLYFGTPGPLDHDANEDDGWRLGLAEFSNGNFTSEDATYPETVVRPIHSFPFPSRNSSTTYSQIKRQISFGDVAPMDYPDGCVGNRVYLRKVADGIKGGIRHSVLPYLTTMRLDDQQSPQSLTQPLKEGRPRINDPNVLNDYHSVLLPKAIEYSAGILDYFFRGRLDVCMTVGGSGPNSLTIVNRSGQGFQGGSFRLFWDDANGVRAEIAAPAFTTTYGTSLADNGSITANFTAPSPNVSAYVLVYQGIIGANGTESIDPVEFDSSQNKGLAIAAKRFICQDGPGEEIDENEFEHGTWSSDGQVVAVMDANARGSKPPGNYRLTYASGYATDFVQPRCNDTVDPCGNCSLNRLYTDTLWPGLASWGPAPNLPRGYREDTLRCPGICDLGWDNSPFEANGANVEQMTRNNYPTPYELCHAGGAFGPVVFQPPPCNGEPHTVTPGSISYTVERQSFRHWNESSGIAMLRIKDFQSVTDSLIAGWAQCAVCETGSALPSWNGEIPLNTSDLCTGFMRWSLQSDPPAVVSLGGRGVLVSVRPLNDLPHSPGSPAQSGWRLQISCMASGGTTSTIWYGYKSKGYTPRGTYLPDPDPAKRGCAAGSLCCITIE